jgi:cytochrome c biogenesis protein CcmG, thiol:disulfide interchange protein DsbE
VSFAARACLILLAVAAFEPPALAKNKVGDPAPHFTVRTFDRQDIDSATLRGQVVIINRWATWCGPCKKELPELDAYYRAHATNGLRIFAVTVDDSVPEDRLKPLSAMLAFPLAYSVRGGFPELDGVPTNYVIDRNGIVRYAQADAFDAAKLDRIVGPLLAEPAPSPATVVASAVR